MCCRAASRLYQPSSNRCLKRTPRSCFTQGREVSSPGSGIYQRPTGRWCHGELLVEITDSVNRPSVTVNLNRIDKKIQMKASGYQQYHHQSWDKLNSPEPWICFLSLFLYLNCKSTPSCYSSACLRVVLQPAGRIIQGASWQITSCLVLVHVFVIVRACQPPVWWAWWDPATHDHSGCVQMNPCLLRFTELH